VVGPLLNPKPRQLIPAHVSRLTSYIKAEGSASPFKKADNRVGPLLNCKSRQLIPARVSRLTSYIKAEGFASPFKKADNKVGPLLNCKSRQLIPARVSRLPSYIKAEVALHLEASPGSDNSCSTFFSSSPISHGGDGLSTICLLFIIYLPDIYEFTLLHSLLLKHASLHRLFRKGESDYL
jgi:hypothetical protein